MSPVPFCVLPLGSSGDPPSLPCALCRLPDMREVLRHWGGGGRGIGGLQLGGYSATGRDALPQLCRLLQGAQQGGTPGLGTGPRQCVCALWAVILCKASALALALLAHPLCAGMRGWTCVCRSCAQLVSAPEELLQLNTTLALTPSTDARPGETQRLSRTRPLAPACILDVYAPFLACSYCSIARPSLYGYTFRAACRESCHVFLPPRG